MGTVSARKIRRMRSRPKLAVDAESYFTKRHTEARKLLLPAYAKAKADRRTVLAKAH